MRKLLITILLIPTISQAQLEIGVGGGVCKTNISEELINYANPATSQSYLRFSTKNPFNASFYLEASYILKTHYQIGLSFEGYQVSYKEVYSDNSVYKGVVYNTLYVPKAFANYIFILHRFNIYVGINAGVPFATESNSGYSIGGNIGSNLHLSKRLSLFANGAIDYLHVNNKASHNYTYGYALNHSFNAFQLIIGVNYRI